MLEQALDNIEKIGIDYLNLHDYIIQESDNGATNEKTRSFILNKVAPLKYALSSVENTEQIISLSTNRNYHFYINHCSMQQREEQMLQRRLRMSKLFHDPEYDFMSKDGTIYNLYLVPDEIYEYSLLDKLADSDFRLRFQTYLLKKENIKEAHCSKGKLLKISYVPQMEINQKKTLIEIKLL